MSRKILRHIPRIILYAFTASLVYLIALKWIMPPFTSFQLMSLYRGEGLKRDYIAWTEIPAGVKLAAIASEDQLFPVHNGFDWKSMEKSLKNTGKKRKGSGASTISQQTAKNIFLFQGSGWTRSLRKVPEFLYTSAIEWIWGKQRILHIYLNTIEMGTGIYGIEAAAQAYFRKSASQLTDAEAAQIIACLPNPRKYRVVPPSAVVQKRKAHILRQMRNIRDMPSVQALTR